MDVANKSSDHLLFLELVGKLKHLRRTGWVLRGVESPETVASHMYRMAATVFILDDAIVDKTKCMEMALVHDLGESIIGDFTPECNITQEQKHKMESDAVSRISKLIGKNGDHVERLFQEYEDQQSAEAKLVKDLDMFDMALQAFEYEKVENNPGRLQEFFDSTQGKYKHPEIITLVNEMNRQRELFINKLS